MNSLDQYLFEARVAEYMTRLELYEMEIQAWFDRAKAEINDRRLTLEEYLKHHAQ